jgi:hypothetical protein
VSNIDRAGSFRGKILDRGVSETKNHYPQLVLQLQATEKYNNESEVWEPWNYDECEATAYVCLFGKDGKATLGVQQAMKALNWDGMSLMTLQTDTSVEDIQWRMEPSTYDDVTRIQVAWIDAYDAEPGRKVRKLDVADIKKLDAKYAAALKAIGGGPKPKSAPPRPPAPAQAQAPMAQPPAGMVVPTPSGEPPFTPDPTPTAEPAAAPVTSVAPDAAEPEKPKRTRKPATPAAPAAPTAPAAPATPVAAVAVDQATAWGAVYTAGKAKGKSDVEITNAWVAVVNEIGGDEKVGSDWSGIRDRTIARLS